MTREQALLYATKLELVSPDEYPEFAGHLMRDCTLSHAETFTRQLEHDDVLKLCSAILRIAVERLTTERTGNG